MNPEQRHEIDLIKLEMTERNFNDRRIYPRYDVRCDAELVGITQQDANNEPILVQIRDIERAGIGFICPTKLTIGDLWRTHFIKEGYQFDQSIIRVCHCVEINDGIYFIGAQFCCESVLLLMLGVDKPYNGRPPLRLHKDDDA